MKKLIVPVGLGLLAYFLFSKKAKGQTRTSFQKDPLAGQPDLYTPPPTAPIKTDEGILVRDDGGMVPTVATPFGTYKYYGEDSIITSPQKNTSSASNQRTTALDFDREVRTAISNGAEILV